MAVRVPLASAAPDIEQVTDLGDSVYRLRFTWNARDAAWYASISTQGGTAIVQGRKVRLACDLLRQFTDSRLPSGALVPLDLAGTGTEPRRDDLGTRVPLLYG